MKRNVCEESTIKKVAKLLRHLKKNCKVIDLEAITLFVVEKKLSSGYCNYRLHFLHIVWSSCNITEPNLSFASSALKAIIFDILNFDIGTSI